MTRPDISDMDLRTLFNGFGVDVPGRDVVDITTDSRAAVRDGLFLACPGHTYHGLQFVDQALQAGVAAVAWEPGGLVRAPVLPPGVAGIPVPALGERLGELADRFFASPSAGLEVTGITGTNGKTTTAWLVVQALERLGGAPAYMGTLGHGLGTRVNPGGLTTPGCIDMHRQLRELATAGARRVVAEVSSHALDQGRVDGVRFGTVAFTNLSRDHLDYHGDLQRYGAAKARLFDTGARIAVINLDDAFGRSLAARLPAGARLVGVSLNGDAGATVQGRLLRQSADGLALAVSGGFGEAELVSPLWGRFNAENLLLALGILCANGWPLRKVAEALAHCLAPPGRMERVSAAPGHPAVLIDFAHTPDALQKALEAARSHCHGKLWCVFGCGGDRDRGKRAPMGQVAVAGADHVIVTDDNPREEDPQQIIADILAGVPSLEHVQVVPERGAAIERAVRSAATDDVVLIAGKGHERVQIIGGTSREFADAEVAGRWLRRPGPGAPP